MEEGKKTAKKTSVTENGESKIPKPATFAAKETRSKASVEKKTALTSKATTKIATITSAKQRLTQIDSFPKKGKRMSVAKISKDVMNHFQGENLKSDDHSTETSTGINILNKENATIRAPLKEKTSQTSQKQSGSLTKKTSASDLKACAAFGGIRFNAKRNTCQKLEMFQKMTKESKDHQAVNPPESLTKELKTTDSATAIASKNIECSNEGSLDVPSAVKVESSKATSLAAKELDKLYPAFAGMRLTPKRKSTHPKPDMFEIVKEESKIDNLESHPSGTSSEPMKMPPGATKVKTETQLSHVEMLEQNSTQKDSHAAAFGGIHFAPKYKSTPIRPDMFDGIQKESKTNHLKSHPTELKTIAAPTTKKIKVKSQHSDKKLELFTSQKLKTDDASKNKKNVSPPAFGGLLFKPRQKNLHGVFETQKFKANNKMQS